MPQKLPKYETDFQIPGYWQETPRYIFFPFHLMKRVPSTSPHWFGGPSLHKGAKCLCCDRPLTLLWDISLEDERIFRPVREALSPITRLPFYTCWHCLTACYRVTSDTTLQRFKCLPDCGSSPFEETPNVLPRRRIGLKPVPTIIDALLSLGIRAKAMDKDAQHLLYKYFKANDSSDPDRAISQLGGESRLIQRREDHACKNPACPASKMKYPYGDIDRRYLLKELGTLYVDADAALASEYVQLQYFICMICQTIYTQYACD